jgi:hypothetical protein
MTDPICGAGRILHGGGPVAVPFRTCCAAALLAALGGALRADTGGALRADTGGALRADTGGARRAGAGVGVALPPHLPCAVAVPADAGSLPAGAEPPVAVGEP